MEVMIGKKYQSKNMNRKHGARNPGKGLLQLMKKELALSKRGELHYVDTLQNAYATVSGTNLSFNNLTMPTIGTGLNSSAAGRITFRSLDFGITMQNISTAQPAAVRHLFCQTIGLDSPIASANVLENVSSGTIACTSPFSFKDQNTNVKHLADLHFDTDPQWNAQQTYFGSVNLPLKESKYSASEAAWTNIPFYLICNTNIATGGLVITTYCRIWFYDGA